MTCWQGDTGAHTTWERTENKPLLRICHHAGGFQATQWVFPITMHLHFGRWGHRGSKAAYPRRPASQKMSWDLNPAPTHWDAITLLLQDQQPLPISFTIMNILDTKYWHPAKGIVSDINDLIYSSPEVEAGGIWCIYQWGIPGSDRSLPAPSHRSGVVELRFGICA